MTDKHYKKLTISRGWIFVNDFKNFFEELKALPTIFVSVHPKHEQSVSHQMILFASCKLIIEINFHFAVNPEVVPNPDQHYLLSFCELFAILSTIFVNNVIDGDGC